MSHPGYSNDREVNASYRSLKDAMYQYAGRPFAIPPEIETLLWEGAEKAAGAAYNGAMNDGGAREHVLSGFAKWALKQMPAKSPGAPGLGIRSFPVPPENVQGTGEPFDQINRVTLGEGVAFAWRDDELITQIPEDTAKRLIGAVDFSPAMDILMLGLLTRCAIKTENGKPFYCLPESAKENDAASFLVRKGLLIRRADVGGPVPGVGLVDSVVLTEAGRVYLRDHLIF